MPFLLQSVPAKLIVTYFMSMVPLLELRASIPFAVAMDVPLGAAALCSVLGNFTPAPFVILLVRKVLDIMHGLGGTADRIAGWIERHAHLKGETVFRYGTIGLCLLVAIPFPGTGAWTGAVVAALLDIRIRVALPAIAIGLCISAAIVSVITAGVVIAV